MGNTVSYFGSGKPTDSLTEADRPHLVSDGCIREYDIKPPIGLALLLGCDRTPYPEDSRLSCVSLDLTRMENALTHCGFKVVNPCLNRTSKEVTLTYEQCTKAFDDIRSDPQLEQYSSFLLYFSGHGISRGILLSEYAPKFDDGCLPYKTIATHLSSIPALAAKPKIFIFDCCRIREEAFKSFDSKIEIKSGGGGRSFSNDTKTFLDGQKEKLVYPPSDSVLCFSTTDGLEAYAPGRDCGSTYTLHLSTSLRKFHKQQSFTEIIHTVHGKVRASRKKYPINDESGEQVIEQPVLEDALNGRLILAAYDPSKREQNDRSREAEEDMEVNPGVQDVLQPEVKGRSFPKPRLVIRDPNWPEKVMKDRVQKPPPVYHSKEDVMKNRDKLGDDVSVFICYAPDPIDPFSNPKEHQAEIHQHELQICDLMKDLERHGFAVTADLSLPEGQLSALRWYASRIDSSDYVIIVCSPSFKQLFSSLTLSAKVIDVRAQRLHQYSNAIYGLLEQGSGDTTKKSKIATVLLSDYDKSSSVPLLFQGGTIYNLFETVPPGPRAFDYSRDSPFERLVCRMAGIDRNTLNVPQERTVHKLPKPSEQGPGSSTTSSDYQMYLQRAQKPRRGYKTVQSKLTQPQPSSSIPPGFQAWSSHPTPTAQPFHPQPPPQPTSHPTPPAAALSQQTLVQPMAAHGQPAGSTPPAVPPSSSNPASQPPDPQKDFPAKEVLKMTFLWLSQNLHNWKFVARFLGVRDAELERIEADNPQDMTEQCYQMLTSWHRRSGKDATYRILGEAMLKTKNADVYAGFVDRVREFETENSN